MNQGMLFVLFYGVYVSLWFTYMIYIYIYILAKGKIYNKLSKGIVAMVLKWLKCTCPTNRKTDA